jgi:hypothetical protein
MFPALRSRNFRLLWLGSFAVNVGWWMHSPVQAGATLCDMLGAVSSASTTRPSPTSPPPG